MQKITKFNWNNKNHIRVEKVKNNWVKNPPKDFKRFKSKLALKNKNKYSMLC